MRVVGSSLRYPLGASVSVLLLFLVLSLTAGACLEQNTQRVEVQSNDCILCHVTEYESVVTPPHMDLGWTDCWQCHVETAWLPAVPLQHDWYPLRFRHAETPCASCHTGDPAVWAGTPTTCVGCHQADYDAALNPPHVGMPTDCAICHVEVGWRPSTFVHAWPLENAHAAAPCASCHAGNPAVWAGTPTTCVGCHLDDYDTSPYPGHSSFPTTCNDCHGTKTWTPALEGAHPENAFPITRGAHAPFECTDCHDPDRGPSAGGANTSCVGCHTGEHARASTDADHANVSNYPFNTTRVNFCLDCHPRGIND